MLASYKTILKEGQFELEEKKSRFIARASLISSKSDAERIINEIRNENKDARHIVYAWRTLNEAGMSDDGEPHGTGGKPVMSVIEKRGLSGVLVTVVRYFGGVLLGAPGLVRAYSSSAVGALDISGEKILTRHCRIIVFAAYDNYGKLLNYFEKSGINFDKPIFTDKVEITVFITPDEKDGRINDMTDLCDGNISFEINDDVFI